MGVLFFTFRIILQNRAEGLSVKVGEGDQEATIGEVNLGVKICNNRTFGYQMDDVLQQIKWKIASLKARTGDLPDIVWGSEILWLRALRPALM